MSFFWFVLSAGATAPGAGGATTEAPQLVPENPFAPFVPEESEYE
jgi:hypothetical protein